MGKHCKLCKIEAVKGGERSFHRFPDPQYQRESWCQALNIDIKTLKNWTFICSDHFPLESFLYRSNGQRFLKDDSVPLPYKGQLKRIGRRKKGYKKIKVEEITVKTEIKMECEDKETQNVDIVREIKVEKVDCIEENKEYANQDYYPDIPVKIEVSEESFNLKTEETVIKQPAEYLNDKMDFERKTNPQSCELNHFIQGIREDEKEDIIPRLFKLAYPELPAADSYFCKECSFQTTFCQNLRKHFIIHRETEFRNDPEKYKEYKTYRCYECSYITIQKYNLSRHMVKHMPNDGKAVKAYSCNECDYSTKYRCDIIKHQVKHIGRGWRFDCTKCSYKAYDQTHLNEHLKKGHIENKIYKYKCQHCPYQTDSKNALNRHVRESHSENRPFKYECASCSFKSDSKSSFNRHMKEGHSKVSSPPAPE